MEKSGCLHGYRWMYTKCCIGGLVVDRESVRVLLQIIDPEGVELRKSWRLRRRIYFNHGPNYSWHIDSNNKLKPYGIFINGCVDGFSRHIIWVEASGGGLARSIAYYFIEAVKCRKGCPRIVRTDMGVENTVLPKMQAFLSREVIKTIVVTTVLYVGTAGQINVLTFGGMSSRNNAYNSGLIYSDKCSKMVILAGTIWTNICYDFASWKLFNYMKAAKVGEDIVIEAKTLKRGKRLAFLSVDIKNKSDGSLLAQGRHTKYIG